MNQNQSGKKLVSFVLIFIGIMVVSPMSMISVLDGFPVFAIVPIVMFVLFGLFSTLIIKSASKKTKNTDSVYYGNSEERHCTSCHESIPVNSEYCPYCGLEQTDFVICDYCGQKNSKNDLMCTNCNGLLK